MKYRIVEHSSARIRRAMEEAGKTPDDLVKETGLSAVTIQRLLSGELQLWARAATLIALSLNTDMGWLLGFDVPTKEMLASDRKLCAIRKLRRDLERNPELLRFSQKIADASDEEYRRILKMWDVYNDFEDLDAVEDKKDDLSVVE